MLHALRPARRWTEGRAVALAGLDATSCKHRFGFVVIDAARLLALALCCCAQNVDARAATLRFSQFRLKLDQSTLDSLHACAVQSKVARAVARPQLQPHTLLEALALLSAAGPAGKSDALRHRDTAADTACRCW